MAQFLNPEFAKVKKNGDLAVLEVQMVHEEVQNRMDFVIVPKVTGKGSRSGFEDTDLRGRNC